MACAFGLFAALALSLVIVSAESNTNVWGPLPNPPVQGSATLSMVALPFMSSATTTSASVLAPSDVHAAFPSGHRAFYIDTSLACNATTSTDRAWPFRPFMSAALRSELASEVSAIESIAGVLGSAITGEGQSSTSHLVGTSSLPGIIPTPITTNTGRALGTHGNMTSAPASGVLSTTTSTTTLAVSSSHSESVTQSSSSAAHPNEAKKSESDLEAAWHLIGLGAAFALL